MADEGATATAITASTTDAANTSATGGNATVTAAVPPAASSTAVAAKPDGTSVLDGNKGTPKTYSLELPKDTHLSKADLDRISKYSLEKGLSQEAAAEIVKAEHESVARHREGQAAEWKKTTEGWFKEASEDKLYGGEKFKETLANIERTVKKIDPDGEFVKEAKASGLDNHPVLFRFLAKLSRMTGADKMVTGGSPKGATDGSDAQAKLNKMFPSTAPKESA